MRATLLICDDDPDVRSAMKRTLRDYQVVETSSSREALEALKTQQPIDAIVADYALGGESDGLDLLYHVKVQYPDVIRCLVTANRDVDVIVRAVNEGAVHRYFLKPWNEQQLPAALEILLHARHVEH